MRGRWGACGLAILTVTVVGFGHAAEVQQIWVHLTSPREGAAAIGEVDLVAEVVARRPVRDVVFFVDGRPVGLLTAAPYRLRVDLGEENLPHRIEVVATDVAAAEARDTVTTRAIELGAEFEVNLRQLYVTVSRNGQQVSDLDRDDFTVLDEGRPQRLVTFARGDVPFTAALLIDSSESMVGGKLEAARAGALAFLAGMRPLDQASVATFSDQVRSVSPFMSNRGVLGGVLLGSDGRGGTAVHDTLYSALKSLEARQGRRVVVLLSDGVDSHSVLDGADVLAHARRGQAMVYWIRLAGRGDDAVEQDRLASAWRTPRDYRRNLDALRELVALSGGREVPARSPEEIRDVFGEILRELRGQYALGYYPSHRRRDGSWHELEVRVQLRGAEVRTHEGYLDL